MFYRIVFKTPTGEKAQPWAKADDLEGATKHARDNAPRYKAASVEVRDERNRVVFTLPEPKHT